MDTKEQRKCRCSGLVMTERDNEVEDPVSTPWRSPRETNERMTIRRFAQVHRTPWRIKSSYNSCLISLCANVEVDTIEALNRRVPLLMVGCFVMTPHRRNVWSLSLSHYHKFSIYRVTIKRWPLHLPCRYLVVFVSAVVFFVLSVFVFVVVVGFIIIFFAIVDFFIDERIYSWRPFNSHPVLSALRNNERQRWYQITSYYPLVDCVNHA